MYHLNTLHRSASKANGFTLIELVIVVALLAILAAIALPRFLDLTDEAHEVSAENISSACEISLREFKGLCNIRGGNATGFSGGMAFPELGVRSSTSGSCYPEAGPPDGRISDQTTAKEPFKGCLNQHQPGSASRTLTHKRC